MEIDVVAAVTPAVTEHDSESDEEYDENITGSVKLRIWRTSKAHR
jgi:hypothetical protein